jgi:hypothetical protein
MAIIKSLLYSKWSLVFKIIVTALCVTALTAEFLPEVKAKIIVVPALIAAIYVCITEIKREWDNKQHQVLD